MPQVNAINDVCMMNGEMAVILYLLSWLCFIEEVLSLLYNHISHNIKKGAICFELLISFLKNDESFFVYLFLKLVSRDLK